MYFSQDPRGPIRHIAAVDRKDDGSRVITLSCGHVPDLASHFAYHVGDECRCFKCGQVGNYGDISKPVR